MYSFAACKSRAKSCEIFDLNFYRNLKFNVYNDTVRVDNLEIRLTSEILLKSLLNALGSFFEQNYCKISTILLNRLYPFCYWWKSDAVCG